MQYLFTFLLNLFQQPRWLACLPLAAVPLLILRIQPCRFQPLPSGWGLDKAHFNLNSFSLRWWRAFLASLALACIIVALSRPSYPRIAFLEMTPRGHHRVIVIDCSGSMAQIDAGQQDSRLKRLTNALNREMQSRPNDRFTIIQVAGYADRVGPPAASPEFLAAFLEQIQPASPGEDGTSLADGLVLALDELNRYDAKRAKEASILLISDGRDNPPDPASQKLNEMESLFIQNAITLNWLRLNLPEPVDETAESRTLAEKAVNTLTTLVKSANGSIISLDQSDNWSSIASKGMALTEIQDLPRMTSVTILFLILALLLSLLANVIFVILIRRFRFYKQLTQLFISATNIISLCLMVFVLLKASEINYIVRQQSLPVQYAENAIGIVIDVSPSMAAKDTSEGSRLETAKAISSAMIRQISAQNHALVSIFAFSGRTVQLTPWSMDYISADTVNRELSLRQIAPDGTNWQDLTSNLIGSFRNLMNLNSALEGKIQFLILTDGESSQRPENEQIILLNDLQIKINVITLGSDVNPGATFQGNSSGSQLWIDKRTAKPARSQRSDELARIISEKTGGSLFAVGTAQPEPFELARNLIGETATVEIAKSDNEDHLLQYLIVALFLLLSIEFIQTVSIHKICLLITFLSIPLMTSCNDDSKTTNMSIILKQSQLLSDSGYLLQSESLLRSAQFKTCNNPMINYHLGLVLLDQNRPEVALIEFQKCLDMINENASTDLLLKARTTYAVGYSRAMLGQWNEALMAMQQALDQPFYQTAENQSERNEIDKNIIFVQYQLKLSNNKDNAKNGSPNNYSGESSVSQKVLVNIELHERARQVRNRARSVRQTFEKPGDQITGPLPNLSNTGLIDW